MASANYISLDPFFSIAPVTFYSAPPSPSDSNRREFEFSTVVDDGFISATAFCSPVHWAAFSGDNNARRGCESFADELFCDAKVVPLKPPPGSRQFAYGSHSPLIGNSPQTSLFSGRSLWNDGFDPFAAALETVKDDKAAGKSNKIRRETFDRFEPGSPEPIANKAGSIFPWEPIKSIEDPLRPKYEAHDGPRGLRITRFLMKSKSMITEEEANKLKKKSLFRRLSFKITNNKSTSTSTLPPISMASSRALAEVMAQQYRPRLFLCVGYGLRSFHYVK